MKSWAGGLWIFGSIIISLGLVSFGIDKSVAFQKNNDECSISRLKFPSSVNSLSEAADPFTGSSIERLFLESNARDIRAWADTEGVPVYEIDPALLDTSNYIGQFSDQGEIPLANDKWPMVFGDVDGNGLIECYGIFKDSSGYQSHVYEIQLGQDPILRHMFDPRRWASIQLSDVDRDSLDEVSFWLGDTIFFYEQEHPDSLPIIPMFDFVMFRREGTSILTRVQIEHLDDDLRSDIIYRGNDVLCPTRSLTE